jgi:hypothetical protein
MGLTRTWKKGDRVVVQMNSHTTVEGVVERVREDRKVVVRVGDQELVRAARFLRAPEGPG